MQWIQHQLGTSELDSINIAPTTRHVEFGGIMGKLLPMRECFFSIFKFMSVYNKLPFLIQNFNHFSTFINTNNRFILKHITTFSFLLKHSSYFEKKMVSPSNPKTPKMSKKNIQNTTTSNPLIHIFFQNQSDHPIYSPLT